MNAPAANTFEVLSMEAKENLDTKSAIKNDRALYRIAGAAAILMMAIVVIQLIMFMIAPPPYEGTVLDWFRIFQKNTFLGLVDFELLMVIYTLVSVFITLALYRLLKSMNPVFTLVYLALSLTGVVAFIIARPVFEMLYLSSGYSAAATEAQKAMFMAAGQNLLAAFNGTAFHISYLLGSLTGLIISLIMLKSQIFSKATAYVRIASSVCDLGLYIPAVGIYISIFSVLFLFAWNFMVARRLFQLGRRK